MNAVRPGWIVFAAILIAPWWRQALWVLGLSLLVVVPAVLAVHHVRQARAGGQPDGLDALISQREREHPRAGQ